MTNKEKKILIIGLGISVFVGVAIFIFIIVRRKTRKLSKRKLLDLVNDDMKFWYGVKETDRKGAEKLKEWWSWLGNNYSVSQLMTPSFQSSHFWSATYISAFMKRWGAGDRFKYSSRHSDYICDGIKARQNKDNDRIFWTYDPVDVEVEVGDIVGVARESWVTLDNLCGGAPTHTDIVYKIKKTDDGFEALVIGGNLGNTVDVKKVTLDKNKKIKNPEKYLAVMKNKMI